MPTMLTQGKAIFLGCRESVGRQQLMQNCGGELSGLRDQAQLERMAIRFDQLISTERLGGK